MRKGKRIQPDIGKLYYRVGLYNDDTILPLLFNSWKEADDYISKEKLHAYITIM